MDLNDRLSAFYHIKYAVESAASGHADIINWVMVREMFRCNEKFFTDAITYKSLHEEEETP